MQNNGESVSTVQSLPKDEIIVNPTDLVSISEENAKLLWENETLKGDLQKEKFYHQNLYNQWNQLNISVIEKDRKLEQLKSTQNPKLKIYQYAFYGLLLLTAVSVTLNFNSFAKRGNKIKEQSSNANSTNTIPDKDPPQNLKKAGEGQLSLEAVTILPVAKNPVKYLIKEKSYFYNRPDNNTQRKTFVLPSDDAYGILTALYDQNGFIYIVFKNHAGRISKGWIHKSDLEPVK